MLFCLFCDVRFLVYYCGLIVGFVCGVYGFVCCLLWDCGFDLTLFVFIVWSVCVTCLRVVARVVCWFNVYDGLLLFGCELVACLSVLRLFWMGCCSSGLGLLKFLVVLFAVYGCFVYLLF